MLETNEENKGPKFELTRRVDLKFWKSCGLNALGLLVASATSSSSIQFGNMFYFAALVVLIWFLNWIIRPVLIVFALPLIIFTMGVGMLFINALIIYMAAALIPDKGIVVSSYWAALWASFCVSVLWWSLEMFKSERIVVFTERVVRGKSASKKPRKDGDDDVIDV